MGQSGIFKQIFYKMSFDYNAKLFATLTTLKNVMYCINPRLLLNIDIGDLTLQMDIQNLLKSPEYMNNYSMRDKMWVVIYRNFENYAGSKLYYKKPANSMAYTKYFYMNSAESNKGVPEQLLPPNLRLDKFAVIPEISINNIIATPIFTDCTYIPFSPWPIIKEMLNTSMYDSSARADHPSFVNIKCVNVDNHIQFWFIYQSQFSLKYELNNCLEYILSELNILTMPNYHLNMTDGTASLLTKVMLKEYLMAESSYADFMIVNKKLHVSIFGNADLTKEIKNKIIPDVESIIREISLKV